MGLQCCTNSIMLARSRLEHLEHATPDMAAVVTLFFECNIGHPFDSVLKIHQRPTLHCCLES